MTDEQGSSEAQGAGAQGAVPRPAGPAKPWKVTAIGGMRLGSGITNVLAGLALFWLVYPLLLIPLGIVEIISGANLLNRNPKAVSGMKTLAILEIVSIIAFNWIALVVGILTLVWLADPEAEAYLATLPPKDAPSAS